ncbi:hypothetical protein BX600DRAFT_517507 [Xylariales sp. PMI_506]|nr:hypothetical protein BX600DRAFT_517507 [Xylariales sp. PMI_506]
MTTAGDFDIPISAEGKPSRPPKGSITLYGAAYSVYVRIVRLVLAEKRVPYTLVPVDIFAASGPPAGYLERHHPFGRIPAFVHHLGDTEDDDFHLYETSAITRYIDEAFPGSPQLQPPATGPGENARRRARVNQVIGILDGYAYRCLVWDIYVERVAKPRDGKGYPDEERIAAALPRAATCLAALAEIMGEEEEEGALFLAGSRELSLADLHAVPVFEYFMQAPEAKALMAPHDNLRGWWERMKNRESFAAIG